MTLPAWYSIDPMFELRVRELEGGYVCEMKFVKEGDWWKHISVDCPEEKRGDKLWFKEFLEACFKCCLKQYEHDFLKSPNGRDSDVSR